MLYPEFPLQNLPQHLSREESRNPYIVIDHFFSDYWLSDATRQLNKWFRSAFTQKSRLDKKEALALLDLRDQLIRLLEAAQLLADDPAGETNTLDLDADESVPPDDTAPYYQPHKTLHAWDCFPRHLDEAEYANPYLVFEKCGKQLNLAGWRKLLKDLFYAAAYDTRVTETVQHDDLYYSCRCLLKLLEACHLVKLRQMDLKSQP